MRSLLFKESYQELRAVPFCFSFHSCQKYLFAYLDSVLQQLVCLGRELDERQAGKKTSYSLLLFKLMGLII